MNSKNQKTIKISLKTYKRLLALKKERGSPICWIVDKAVEYNFPER
jgi:predicted DNA-binding protein